MPEMYRSVLKCLLCGKNCSSRSSLTRHIYEHLLYRKYECSTCVELFYTEEEREAHCRSEGHCHAFGMKVSPYSELYANQLLRDTEYEAIYGIDVVVMQRSQANMACDSSMRKLHKNDDADRSKPGGSFGHSQTPSSTNERQTSAKVKALSTTGGIGGLKSLAKAGERASRAKDDNGPITNEDWIRLEVSKYAKAAEMASETLRSSAPETHCMICRTLTPSEYVLRKLHVSSSHMDKDHAQSDYVEILSDVMKKAYPTFPHNDLQCQIGGCGKEYKSQSARRSHVLRIHFQHELCCPLNCSYRSNDFANVNSHLKEHHGLKNGYLSIPSQYVRDQFSNERAKHNSILNGLVLLAFPCPIPDSKSAFNNTEQSSGAVVKGLVSRIRERDRTFQQAPPNPLRLHSPRSILNPDSSQMLSTSSSSTDVSSESDLESNDAVAKKPHISPMMC